MGSLAEKIAFHSKRDDDGRAAAAPDQHLLQCGRWRSFNASWRLATTERASPRPQTAAAATASSSLAPHDDLIVEAPVLEGWVGANRHIRMGGGDCAQRVAVPALGNAARLDRLDLHRRARLHRLHGKVEHGLHDGRDAGHDIHVANAETRRHGDWILDELRSGWDARHPPPRGRQIARRIALEHRGDDPRILVNRDAKRARNRVGGDIVVRRADAPRRDDIIVACPERVDGRDDVVLDIGDHPRFLDVDADLRQIFGDIAEVAVLGAPRQDLVADHQDGGGYSCRFRHRPVSPHAQQSEPAAT